MENRFEIALKNICSNCEKLINSINVPIRENEISNGNCGHQLCPYRHIDNSYCEDIETLQELIDEHQRLLTERDRLAYELCEAKNNDANKMLEMIAKGTTQYYGK